jgi:hypothetical protein
LQKCDVNNDAKDERDFEFTQEVLEDHKQNGTRSAFRRFYE